MKKIIYLSMAILAMGFFTACDIDDVENLTELSTSVFPATDDDATAVIAAVYQNLNLVNANPQCSFLYAACLASDDQLGGGGDNDKLMQALDLMLNYGSDMTSQFWSDRYTGIARANNVISSLEVNESMSEDTRNRYIAEAKFLRAFYYYELSSFYGNVPLALNSEDDAYQNSDFETGIKEIWAQILTDLVYACENMADERYTDGHVDKYTAEAMLARAYLFYTGFFCNGFTIEAMASEDYNRLTSAPLNDGETLTDSQVQAYLEDCVNNSGYYLVPDFRNLWAYTNSYTVDDYQYTAGQGLEWVENDGAVNPESMFAIKFNKYASWSTTIGYANGYALHFSCRGGQSVDESGTFPFGQGWGAGPVAPGLYEDWVAAEPNDMRIKATIAVTSDTTDMKAYTKGGWGDFVQETDYYGKKWSAISALVDTTSSDYETYGSAVYCFETLMYPGNWDTSGENNFQLSNIHDLVLIRFADALLMLSEISGDAQYMNQVRARAGLSDKSYSLENLQNERRWELACEGIRWNDIRRWHIAQTALAAQQDVTCYHAGAEDTNSAHGGGYVSRYQATAGFQAMPDTQLDLAVVSQNEGWGTSVSTYSGW